MQPMKNRKRFITQMAATRVPFAKITIMISLLEIQALLAGLPKFAHQLPAPSSDVSLFLESLDSSEITLVAVVQTIHVKQC